MNQLFTANFNFIYMDQEHRRSKEPGFDLNTCFKTMADENVIGYVKDENYYYDSYSHFSIHEEMLKD